jgi:hypothetical protein
MSASAATPAVRQRRSKLAATCCQASPTIAAGTTPAGVIDFSMALLSFADSAPRAYWLKVGNAYLTFSTSTGTFPQFIYLLLNNERIRHVIDAITSKVVLILGRFTPERKVVLDALREELRKRDYLPVLFDFEKPASKSLTGTVQTLAHMARFVIADLTEPSSVPHELAAVVPRTIVPVQAVLLEGQRAYSMFVDLRQYHWVLEPYLYASPERLIADLGEKVIGPAETKARELRVQHRS